MRSNGTPGALVLEDGSVFDGYVFGAPVSVAGEVVFNTGMVGYPEALTDPSYKGQILVLTYPLIGNYGMPDSHSGENLHSPLESSQAQIQGLVVADYSFEYSHWDAAKSLNIWLQDYGVPGLYGIDTRMLAKRLRERGSMLGKILVAKESVEFHDPNQENLAAMVSVPEPIEYAGGSHRVVVIDCGCKNSIIRSLLARGVSVLRVPWDYDFLTEEFDAVVISNGPGDPKLCGPTIDHVRRLMELRRPVFGICLGHQILGLAAGADTYKLKFGHHSQNQPCIELATQRCYITSQNHGYAVRPETLPDGWEPWFRNANDGTNEGLRHRSHPFMSVQFHPEAAPGPVDSGYLFDEFLNLL